MSSLWRSTKKDPPKTEEDSEDEYFHTVNYDNDWQALQIDATAPNYASRLGPGTMRDCPEDHDYEPNRQRYLAKRNQPEPPPPIAPGTFKGLFNNSVGGVKKFADYAFDSASQAFEQGGARARAASGIKIGWKVAKNAVAGALKAVDVIPDTGTRRGNWYSQSQADETLSMTESSATESEPDNEGNNIPIQKTRKQRAPFSSGEDEIDEEGEELGKALAHSPFIPSLQQASPLGQQSWSSIDSDMSSEHNTRLGIPRYSTTSRSLRNAPSTANANAVNGAETVNTVLYANNTTVAQPWAGPRRNPFLSPSAAQVAERSTHAGGVAPSREN